MADNQPQPAKLDTYHLVLYQSGEDLLRRSTANAISERLDRTIGTPPENTQIDLWLDSPGGDAHSAYKIYLDIRNRCKIFRAIVPDYAKSAATLLVLGADEILMGPTAELGPLDAQVEHPDREGKFISALDAARAVNYLAELASDLTLSAGPAFLKLTELPRSDVMHELLRFMARFLEPMVSKLDPQLVHHARNDLRVAQEYAIRLLHDKYARNPEKVDEAIAPEDIASTLVSEYPEHGFVISRGEANELGLMIGEAEKHPRWMKFKSLNTIVCWKQGESFLEVVRDCDLDKENEQSGDDSDETTGEANDSQPGAESGVAAGQIDVPEAK
jgi:Serine dehydrogenase proteinase